MEGFNYVDLFATKGIEYILVILFLISFTFYIKYLNSTPKKLREKSKEFEPKLALVDWFYLAKDFLYHQGHSWVFPQAGNIVKIGVDDFLQKMIGSPDKINLPEVGSKLQQNISGWNFEIDNKTIDVLAPVEGIVTEVNHKIIEDPSLINKENYGNGWLMKVEVPDLKVQKKGLLTENLAKSWIEYTVDNLNKLMNNQLGIVMQDGGDIVSGFMKEISKDNWDKEVKKFLMTD